MTDSTEPRAEGLKPCPEIMYVCENCADYYQEGCGHYDAGDVRFSTTGRWLCESCFGEESDALWSEAIRSPKMVPARPTTDTVERAAVERAVQCVRDKVDLARQADYFNAGAHHIHMVVLGAIDDVAAAIRDLPSAAGGEDKLRELEAAAQRALGVLRQIAVKRRGVGPLATAAQSAAWQLSAALQQEPSMAGGEDKLREAVIHLFEGGFVDAGTREHSQWAQELERRLAPIRAALQQEPTK